MKILEILNQNSVKINLTDFEKIETDSVSYVEYFSYYYTKF